jgi:hypothetical protein
MPSARAIAPKRHAANLVLEVVIGATTLQGAYRRVACGFFEGNGARSGYTDVTADPGLDKQHTGADVGATSRSTILGARMAALI